MNESSAQKLEPWVVTDPDLKREWVLPQPLRYYVVKDRGTRKWFICDRWTDLAVPGTESATRPEAIRRFYRWCKREMPEGATIAKASAAAALFLLSIAVMDTRKQRP